MLKIIMLSVLFVLLGLFVLALIKNEVTYRDHIKITDAIGRYRLNCINRGRLCLVDFDDMESYDDTFARWWGWGYTRILPPHLYAIIEPYIRKEK